jgi:hypothetical protein
MGFCATTKADPPSKNRVVVFSRSSIACAGSFGSEPVELRQENGSMGTATVSGVFCWLSKDPIDILGGLNLYAFVGNNPVNSRDPSGLGDYPGTWDNGVVVNSAGYSIVVIDSDSGIVSILDPGGITSKTIDTDFIVTGNNVIKVGPNTVTVQNWCWTSTASVLFGPSHFSRYATPDEIADVLNKLINAIISNSVVHGQSPCGKTGKTCP